MMHAYGALFYSSKQHSWRNNLPILTSWQSYANNGLILLMHSFTAISSLMSKLITSFLTSTYIHNNQPFDATTGQISCKHVRSIMKKPNIHFFLSTLKYVTYIILLKSLIITLRFSFGNFCWYEHILKLKCGYYVKLFHTYPMPQGLQVSLILSVLNHNHAMSKSSKWKLIHVFCIF
jgi:hypothetical protein